MLELQREHVAPVRFLYTDHFTEHQKIAGLHFHRGLVGDWQRRYDPHSAAGHIDGYCPKWRRVLRAQNGDCYFLINLDSSFFASFHSILIGAGTRDLRRFMLFSNFVYAGTVVTVWCRHLAAPYPVLTSRPIMEDLL